MTILSRPPQTGENIQNMLASCQQPAEEDSSLLPGYCFDMCLVL